MNTNEEIRRELGQLQQESLQNFTATPQVNDIFKQLFNRLYEFDTKSYKQKLLDELNKNCANWWINTDKGIKPEEELYAIYFEYDYLFEENPQALAYGMAAQGDFATEFYANPGITMSICNPLEILDWNKFPKAALSGAGFGHGIEDMPGFEDLVNSYVFTNHQVLSEALAEFSETELYKKINTQKGFQFQIAEHDTGDVFPLWVDE